MLKSEEKAIFANAVWKGFTTNYLRVAVRLVKTVFLTRLLLLTLGEEYYGCWALIWTVFGYALLLEFGFGRALQRYAAGDLSSPEGIKFFNRVFSAILASYVLISFIILGATAVLTYFMNRIFVIPPDKLVYFQKVFLTFGIGCAVVFPTGIFTEILTGMQKLYWRNYIIILNQVLELFLIWFAFRCGGFLIAIAFCVCLNNLFSNILIAWQVFRTCPGIRFTWKGLTMDTFRKISDFSIYSYLMSLAALISFKTDKLVLGVFSGITAVAVYQMGTRLPEMFDFANGQLRETVGPVAANLHQRGKTEDLREFMLLIGKASAFIAAGAGIIMAVLAEVVLKLWLRIEDPLVSRITWLMLLSCFISACFRNVGFWFIQMAGGHKKIGILAIGEACANLALSLCLVFRYGVLGVVLGTLIPNALMSLFLLLPMIAKQIGISSAGYLKKVFLPLIPAGLLCAVPLVLGRIFLRNWSWTSLLAISAAAGMLYAISGSLLLFSASERRAFADRFHLTGVLRKTPCGNFLLGK